MAEGRHLSTLAWSETGSRSFGTFSRRPLSSSEVARRKLEAIVEAARTIRLRLPG